MELSLINRMQPDSLRNTHCKFGHLEFVLNVLKHDGNFAIKTGT